MRKVIIMVVLTVAVLTAACTPPGLAISTSDNAVATATYPVDVMLQQATDTFGHTCQVLNESLLGWMSGITDTDTIEEFFALSEANQDAAYWIMIEDAGPYTDRWMDDCYDMAMAA